MGQPVELPHLASKCLHPELHLQSPKTSNNEVQILGTDLGLKLSWVLNQMPGAVMPNISTKFSMHPDMQGQTGL